VFFSNCNLGYRVQDCCAYTAICESANIVFCMQDETWCRQQLDDLADQVKEKLGPSRYPLKILETVSRHLYDTLGFHGAEPSTIPTCLQKGFMVPQPRVLN
jgi:regulator of sirC expression with transglutaminase-like and TPR domain